MAYPHSREYTTLAQIAPEAEWTDWTPPADGSVLVWDPVYGQQAATVALSSLSIAVALEQSGLCGIFSTTFRKIMPRLAR